MNKAIVYVHLQNNLPRCFWSSIAKVRETWDGDIYLVAPLREEAWEDLKKYNVLFIAEEKIEDAAIKSYEERTFFNKIHIGWDGFWDNACKRFFYLSYIQRTFLIDQIIHLETDVVPYRSITEMFKDFGRVYPNKIVLSPHAPCQVSCCFIYCNATEAMLRLCDNFLAYFERGPMFFYQRYPLQTILNETHFANLFCEEHPELVDYFPTMPGEPHHLDLGYLIDSTAWGMWVGGLNYSPVTQYATPNHNIGKLIIEGKYDVLWKYTNEKLKLPYVWDKLSNGVFPLATLHFNSKRPEKWI